MDRLGQVRGSRELAPRANRLLRDFSLVYVGGLRVRSYADLPLRYKKKNFA